MPHNPHDAVVKRVFSEVENAAGELRAVLPAKLVAALDFGSLRLEPGSFVDEVLEESHTDLLYSRASFVSDTPTPRTGSCAIR